MRIYTRRGDAGMTDLRAGGRVPKDDRSIELTGTVDEAQAALGLARAEAPPGGALDGLLVSLERDLWIVMAEVATAEEQRRELEPGVTAVTASMVGLLESRIDEVTEALDLARGFAVPGGTRCAAALDLARTVVRRAERLAVGSCPGTSLVGAYLNRLSDLCWALARSTEGEHLRVRDVAPGGVAQRSGIRAADIPAAGIRADRMNDGGEG